MAGNVILIKHAGSVTQCATAFDELMTESGPPEGLYTNLFISHDQANNLISNPRIKGVALTGSVSAGSSVTSSAGQNLKVSSMELDGSDAFIVIEDADLEKVVKSAIWGRMYNAGQTCYAAKRFIVIEELADEFLENFQSELSKFRPGDPIDKTTTLAPLSTDSALLGLIKKVNSAVKHGAKLLIGGKRCDHKGAFMQPTILTGVSPYNAAYRDEFLDQLQCFSVLKLKMKPLR